MPEDNKSQERKLEQLEYPASEDIFNQQEHIPLDSEEAPAWLNDTEAMEQNLDVPGAELDNEQAFVGSEDEENNYWSLGGDNHEDLEQPEL